MFPADSKLQSPWLAEKLREETLGSPVRTNLVVSHGFGTVEAIDPSPIQYAPYEIWRIRVRWDDGSDDALKRASALHWRERPKVHDRVARAPGHNVERFVFPENSKLQTESVAFERARHQDPRVKPEGSLVQTTLRPPKANVKYVVTVRYNRDPDSTEQSALYKAVRPFMELQGAHGYPKFIAGHTTTLHFIPLPGATLDEVGEAVAMYAGEATETRRIIESWGLEAFVMGEKKPFDFYGRYQGSSVRTTLGLPKPRPRRRHSLRTGDRVVVAEGSGLSSGRRGVIVPISAFKGKPMTNWNQELAVRYDDGEVGTMFRNRLRLEEP